MPGGDSAACGWRGRRTWSSGPRIARLRAMRGRSWRPADIEQRDGRILRQGNQNPKVGNYRYAVEGSFDAYSWQTVERKARFIAQIMRGRLACMCCAWRGNVGRAANLLHRARVGPGARSRDIPEGAPHGHDRARHHRHDITRCRSRRRRECAQRGCAGDLQPTLRRALHGGFWRYYLWNVSDWKNFTDKWSALAKDGLRLISFDTIQDGATTWYIGTWIQSTDGYALL